MQKNEESSKEGGKLLKYLIELAFNAHAFAGVVSISMSFVSKIATSSLFNSKVAAAVADEEIHKSK